MVSGGDVSEKSIAFSQILLVMFSIFSFAFLIGEAAAGSVGLLVAGGSFYHVREIATSKYYNR